MGNLFQKFWLLPRKHATDDTLLSLLDGELSAVQVRRIRKHLELCWTCRARLGQIEKTIGGFIRYREQIVRPYMPPPLRGRERFLARLDELIQTRKQPWWAHPMRTLRGLAPKSMSPIFASVFIVGVAAILLLFVWQRNLPPVSAHEFLVKAQVWDTEPSSEVHPGVVYQKVEIHTNTQKLQRAIYRDAVGIRKPRPVSLNAGDEAVKEELESVGVNWQKPLSATSFEEWHDRQPAFTDKVTRSGDLLLTLTTSLPSGPVVSESFTVRANDFHPVKRTIETRNDGLIEIAELNYAVFGWNEVNEALFEPLVMPPAPHPVTPIVRPALPILPALPTAAELDIAELETRLALNRLHADEGERIGITRTDSDIEVKGIVDTEARKQEIVENLQNLPHVKTEMLSVAEIQSDFPETSYSQPTSAQLIEPAASPLARYLDAQPRKSFLLNGPPQALVDSAFQARHSADELNAVVAEFAVADKSPAEKAALSQLKQSYTERLLEALDRESSTLRQLGLDETGSTPAGTAALADLADEVQRNDTLCLELVTGGSSGTRSASQIAADIRGSIARIRSAIPPIQIVGKEQARGSPPNAQKKN